MDKDNFTDKLLACVECGEEFLFTAGEQAYYKSKLLSQTKRCPACRRRRRKSLVPEAVQDEN